MFSSAQVQETKHVDASRGNGRQVGMQKPKPQRKYAPARSSKNSSTKSRSNDKQAASKARAKLRAIPPRTEAQYQAAPEKLKETWDRVLAAISNMRTAKISLSQASRQAGTTPRTVAKWGKSALQKRNNGQYKAKPSDNLLRLVLIPTPDGTREIAVRGSKQVTLLAEYWNALHRYLQTGDAAPLKTFQSKSIKDANGMETPLTVDLAVLNRLGSAGVLSFESLYARTA